MLSLGPGREAVHLKSWSEIVGKLPGPRLQSRGRSVAWEPVPAAHVLSPLSSWTSWALGSKGQKKAGEDAGAGSPSIWKARPRSRAADTAQASPAILFWGRKEISISLGVYCPFREKWTEC